MKFFSWQVRKWVGWWAGFYLTLFAGCSGLGMFVAGDLDIAISISAFICTLYSLVTIPMFIRHYDD